jgi:ectoine hydroxylase-related dioxygenase (phytanoyl-CoA dioxygenase family)
MTATLTPRVDAVLDTFARDGVAIVERCLTPTQLAAAQRAVAWAMEQPDNTYKWIPQRTYRWFRERPVFVELIEHPLVIEFARAWLGPEFHLIAAQCSRNTKADPYAPGAMAIHADECFYTKPERTAPGVEPDRYSFSAMWYMQDTPTEMGPTQFVPGSQRSARRYTEAELTDEMLWRRPVPAGSLLLFNHRTWHRGRLNQTDTPRDLITNAYARPEIDKVQLTVKREDGAEAYEERSDLLAACSDTIRMLLRTR